MTPTLGMTLMLEGLGENGVEREAGPGVLGIVDFSEVVHFASIVVEAEFSLSAAESRGLVGLCRTRTGEPRTDVLLDTLAFRVDAPSG